jgi:hypothetical protein
VEIAVAAVVAVAVIAIVAKTFTAFGK